MATYRDPVTDGPAHEDHLRGHCRGGLTVVISYRYAFELMLYGGLTREVRLGYWGAAGGASDARAAVAPERTGGPARGRGGLPIVLR